MTNQRQKIYNWLNDPKTPEDAWRTMTWKEISEATGVPHGTVHHHLPPIVSELKDTVPSQVLEAREHYNRSIGRQTGRLRNAISLEKLRKLKKLRMQNPPVCALDCAYLLGTSQRLVEKMIEKHDL